MSSSADFAIRVAPPERLGSASGDTGRIQEALDAAAALGGGVVQLEPGTYQLDGPVRLGSGTVLESVFPEEPAELVRCQAYQSPLAADADFGEQVVAVEDASGFRAGMGVAVLDDLSDDWLVSTAVIVRVVGLCLHLDRRLISDYLSDKGGRVVSASSMIEAVAVRNVTVQHLRLDGSGGHAFLNGCRGGAIYFYDVQDSEIRGVEVANFAGDGISWQITEGVTVTDSVVRGAARYGFHPGTGARGTRVTGCRAEDNGSDGLYLCWRVEGGVFEHSRFSGNGGAGISLGHKDSGNMFRSNVIENNAGGGMRFRLEKESNGARRNSFTNNVVYGNAEAGIKVDGPHHGLRIWSNNFAGQDRPVLIGVGGAEVESDIPVIRSESPH